MTTDSISDRIEKTIVLRAPRSRVWRAIASAEEFGTWFGVRMQGVFAPGARLTGQIVIPGYEHVTLVLVVDQLVPERTFSYRWHPHAVDPAVDYSREPMTLVEFHLADEADGGTRLTVVESGFDQIPAERRITAFRMNEGGWAGQVKNIERYLTGRVSAGR